MNIRLLMADDHEVVRVGLASLLAGTNIEIVGQATSGEEVLRMAEEVSPDVVLVDIRMAEVDGLSALETLKQRSADVPVVVLSTYDNPAYISRAIGLGASGYLLKGCDRERLVAVLTKAATGEMAWSPEELRRFGGASAASRQSTDVEVTLTKRESEVLEQLAGGLTNKQIAKALHIGYETVKEHVQNILRKIGVSDRTQAAVWAVRKGLV